MSNAGQQTDKSTKDERLDADIEQTENAFATANCNLFQEQYDVIWVFLLTSIIALAFLVVFALFGLFFLTENASYSFFLAIAIYSIVFSVIFAALAIFFGVSLIRTRPQFIRVETGAFRESRIYAKGDLQSSQLSEKVKTKSDYTCNPNRRRLIGFFLGRNWRTAILLVIPPLLFLIYGIATLAAAVVLLLAVIAKQNFLINDPLRTVNSVGVLLFIASYVALFIVGRRTVNELHRPHCYEKIAPLGFIDYLLASAPRSVHVGDSKQIWVNLFRDGAQYDASSSAYLEAEIQAAGLQIDGEKRLKLPDRFCTQRVSWNCYFPDTGERTITFKLNKGSSVNDTKDAIFDTSFAVKVISPFRASIQPALAVIIAALSAVTALFNVLHLP
jgi:hypothetical protein